MFECYIYFELSFYLNILGLPGMCDFYKVLIRYEFSKIGYIDGHFI